MRRRTACYLLYFSVGAIQTAALWRLSDGAFVPTDKPASEVALAVGAITFVMIAAWPYITLMGLLYLLGRIALRLGAS